jgi:hypothetical protein
VTAIVSYGFLGHLVGAAVRKKHHHSSFNHRAEFAFGLDIIWVHHFWDRSWVIYLVALRLFFSCEFYIGEFL